VAMRRLVGAELVVAALAVLAATTMVTIQAAASRQPLISAPAVAPAHYTAALDHAQIHLTVSLPAPGTQSYRVSLRHPGDTEMPNPIQKVFLTFLPPSGATVPAERVELEADDTGGLWTVSGPYTPFVGDWTVELVVRREGLVDASFPFDLEVVDPGPAQLGPPADSGVGVPAPIAAVWGLLPAGMAGWLPGVVALGLLVLAGRLRSSTLRDVVRGASAAVVIVALIGAGSRELVAAANAPTDAELGDQPAVESPDLENGRLVYRANCASCHGIELDGQGSIGSLPPAGGLVDGVRSASDAELSYRISYGLAGTAMPAFAGSLTAEERGDLIGYLRDAVGSR
jgi:mono/diheme cytochrome c family protein